MRYSVIYIVKRAASGRTDPNVMPWAVEVCRFRVKRKRPVGSAVRTRLLSPSGRSRTGLKAVTHGTGRERTEQLQHVGGVDLHIQPGRLDIRPHLHPPTLRPRLVYLWIAAGKALPQRFLPSQPGA